jgi:hypothetical protein
MGHEPNNQREAKKIVKPPTSKLKGSENAKPKPKSKV